MWKRHNTVETKWRKEIENKSRKGFEGKWINDTSFFDQLNQWTNAVYAWVGLAKRAALVDKVEPAFFL